MGIGEGGWPATDELSTASTIFNTCLLCLAVVLIPPEWDKKRSQPHDMCAVLGMLAVNPVYGCGAASIVWHLRTSELLGRTQSLACLQIEPEANQRFSKPSLNPLNAGLFTAQRYMERKRRMLRFATGSAASHRKRPLEWPLDLAKSGKPSPDPQIPKALLLFQTLWPSKL